MSRNKLSSLVSRQVPEFIREDYPTFIAFLEAYYEWLQTQLVDYNDISDLDKTLDEFLVYFKKELAYNLPALITSNERFYLERIKDIYLAKGSEASYKLLFRLLYNKEVQLSYPGQQLLRASDGRWNQELSLFAKVMYGDPNVVVGKIVEIETGSTVIKVPIDRRQDIEGEVDRIVALGGNVYEFFIDRKYYGVIKPGNRIKYGDLFQAEILPVPVHIEVLFKGSGFKVGQLFKIQSSTGTSTLVKITRVDENGGIKNAEIIKFGVNYLTDFTSALLPTSEIASSDRPFSTESVFTISITDNGANPTPQNYPPGTDQYEAEIRNETFNVTMQDPPIKFNEIGFISRADYVYAGETYYDSGTNSYLSTGWVDGAYAGTLISEFQTTAVNAATQQLDPAVLIIKLDAVASYPGYFVTNNGFLSDSIIVQDSKYYQAFSYVIKLDERLDSYKSAVKTMLHPAGIELFGEFEITDKIDLALEVESMIKSLVLRFKEDPGIALEDSISKHTFKNFTTDDFTLTEPSIYYNNAYHIGTNNFVGGAQSIVTMKLNKTVDEEYVLQSTPDIATISYTTSKDDSISVTDAISSIAPALLKADSFSLLSSTAISQDKFFADEAVDYFEDTLIVVELNGTTKYTMLPTQNIIQNEAGYVVLNSYTDGSYFSQHYVNNRDATFSS